MGQFILNNGLISKNNSTITGSLNIVGQITASHFGTSSYVVTASYALNSDTASYTTTTSVLSASYATIATSASIAQTASIALNPSYGPTPGIGYITPNILMNNPFLQTNGLIIATSSATLGGTLMFPFMINKDCTLVTMSLLGGTQSNNVTCSIGIYSNSINSLPEYLIVSGTIKTGSANAVALLYNSSDFTPTKLYANNIYWVAQTSNAAGAFYSWRPAQFLFAVAPSYNPLLGYSIVTSGSGAPQNFLYPMWCIRSGSFSATLATTASQSTSSYFPPSGSYGGNIGVQLTAPYLKVTYP
jgi:hypothetical protein